MEKIHEEVTATINSVHEIWAEIYGIEDPLNPARVDDLKTKILNFCDALQDQAENQKNALIKRVEDVLKEIIELEQLLDVEEHSVKDYKNIDVPLVEMHCQLWSILSKYRAERDQRMEKLKTLQAKQQTIYTFLNLPIPSLNLQHGSIPTPAELENMEEEIYKLEVQQRHMVDDFYESRKAVASLIKELDVIPVSICEMAAVEENDAMFPPSSKNLEEMELAQQNLMLKLKNTKLEADELRAKLKEMWARCKRDSNDLKKILNRNSGHSKVDISQLKTELKICKEERQTRMKEFIMDLREEIVKYWDKCYFSEEDKKKFKTFYTNDYNEDVLVIHELELENLKKHCEKYKHIYELTEKRKEFWDRLKSIEQVTRDRNRLFRSKGGQLLQEEKERKTIQKELPKIEEELQECIVEYENETGLPFYMYGHNLRDVIKSEWDNWQANKDSLKKARQLEKTHNNESGWCQNSVKPPTSDRILHTLNLPNAIIRTPNKPSQIPTNKTPMKTPIKTPTKSPSRIATGSKIPALVEPVKSPGGSSRAAALKLTPARGKLPIII